MKRKGDAGKLRDTKKKSLEAGAAVWPKSPVLVVHCPYDILVLCVLMDILVIVKAIDFKCDYSENWQWQLLKPHYARNGGFFAILCPYSFLVKFTYTPLS